MAHVVRLTLKCAHSKFKHKYNITFPNNTSRAPWLLQSPSQDKNKLRVAVVIVSNIFVVLSVCLVFIYFAAVEDIEQDPIFISTSSRVTAGGKERHTKTKPQPTNWGLRYALGDNEAHSSQGKWKWQRIHHSLQLPAASLMSWHACSDRRNCLSSRQEHMGH